MKIYTIMEKKSIETFEDKKEAEANLDNMSMWYPENSYEIIEQEITLEGEK